jgi:hypothetical protein
MSGERKKIGAPVVATMFLVAALLAYPISFGPACWWFSQKGLAAARAVRIASQIYWPFGWIIANGPRPVRRVVNWYATLCRDDVILPASAFGYDAVAASVDPSRRTNP